MSTKIQEKRWMDSICNSSLPDTPTVHLFSDTKCPRRAILTSDVGHGHTVSPQTPASQHQCRWTHGLGGAGATGVNVPGPEPRGTRHGGKAAARMESTDPLG